MNTILIIFFITYLIFHRMSLKLDKQIDNEYFEKIINSKVERLIK